MCSFTQTPLYDSVVWLPHGTRLHLVQGGSQTPLTHLGFLVKLDSHHRWVTTKTVRHKSGRDVFCWNTTSELWILTVKSENVWNTLRAWAEYDKFTLGACQFYGLYHDNIVEPRQTYL